MPHVFARSRLAGAADGPAAAEAGGCLGAWRPRPEVAGLWAILALAFALRAYAAWTLPDAHHPDEVFQTFEQAHRYAFGYGIVPWEFHLGLRSTLPPALLSLVFRAGDALFDAPAAPVVLARLVLVALSLLPVAAIYAAGLRRSPLHALVGGIAAATWCELVYFSYRPLTEALAADALLAALALASFRGAEIPRRVLLGIGMCLGCVLMLRIHFAPGVAVMVAWLAPRLQPNRLCALGLGALPPLAAFGLADVLAWGIPFEPPVMAIWINVGRDAASTYGVSPAGAYFGLAVGLFAPIAPLIVVPLVMRVRAYGLWLLVAAAILVSHSAIPHKEYRFVFVATVMVVVAAAFASADLLARLDAHRRAGRGGRAAFAATLAAIWAIAALLVAAGEDQREMRERYAPETRAFEFLVRQPDLCGLLLDEVHWSVTPGYTALRRDVPIYGTDDGGPTRPPTTSAANYTLAVQPIDRSGLGEQRLMCVARGKQPGVCVWRRPGGCRPDPTREPLPRQLVGTR